MVNGIRTSDPPHTLNKGCGSKFHVGSQVQQTPEEGWRTYRPKRCEYKNKDEDNSLKTLNNKKKKRFHYHLKIVKFVIDVFLIL